MYLKTDHLGHSEILDDEDVRIHGDTFDEVRTKQAQILQRIQSSIQNKNDEISRVNKSRSQANAKRGWNLPLMKDLPVLIQDDEYRKMKTPYRTVVDHFLKNGQLRLYSQREPDQPTYFVIIEPFVSPSHPPQFSEL